jgi:hypothetical protein
MPQSSQYYRARLDVIENLIDQAVRNKNEEEIAYLRNAFIPAGYNLEALTFEQLAKKNYDGRPLDFDEVTRYSTWFAMHPEKVAGTETPTSSLEFPVTVKGTKEDIIKTITGNLEMMDVSNKFKSSLKEFQQKQKEEAEMEAEAEAIALELELTKL